MAITIDWAARIILVPRADLALIQLAPVEVRELNLNTFRLILKSLEESAEGMVWPTTHNHVTAVTVGGVQLARVVELINDYTVTFEDGQYAVNLVGANSNVADRVNVNQVSVRASNSAGLIQSREIEHASYDDCVTIDAIAGTSGTSFPSGTPTTPVNNIDDAVLIAGIRGLRRFCVRSTLVLATGDYTDYSFEGERRGVVLVGAGATFMNCRFEGLILTGNFTSLGIGIKRCAISDAAVSDAYIEETAISGTLTITGAGPTWILSCIDADETLGLPALDLATFSGDLFIRQFYGGITFLNATAGVTLRADLQGTITLDSSVTGGDYSVRGIGRVIDNSTGTTVDVTDLITNGSIATKVLTDPRALTVGKYLGLK